LFENLPVIHDPWFWAVAVPVVWLAGVSKSGFASGLATLATPMMALTIPVPQAAAVMLPLLLVMDAAGLQQLWQRRDRALVRLLVPWGLFGVAIGTALFGVMPAAALSGVVGALTLLFVAQRLLFPPSAGKPAAPLWVGRLCATLSGATSFIVHAGGPPIHAYVLPLRLAPLVTGASMAVFFAAINGAKVAPYALLGLLDLRNLATAVLLMPIAGFGVWVGVRLLHRVNATWFYRVAYTGMTLAGLKLLSDGLRAAFV
jgi:uncharacterized protein